ncbi:MAG TPA: nucleotidyltransferase family protein [Gammaproteobacteria bacterium]|nr:nucleotidyltransferase family protein [Gammaproteobacteria bacterium]
MKAMILAAGRGERLRPLTDTTPKPLIEVRGKPLIQWHIERLRDAGFTRLVINVSWLADRIQAHLGDGTQFGVRIGFSHEGAKPLETGGGIFKALALLGKEPFLVVNGDIYTDFPFEDIKHRLKHDALAHLVMVPNPSHHPEGDFHLSPLGRLRNRGKPRLTYSGIGIYRPEFFHDCPAGKFPLLPWLKNAMQMEALSGEEYLGAWWDVGTVDSLKRLEKM